MKKLFLLFFAVSLLALTPPEESLLNKVDNEYQNASQAKEEMCFVQNSEEMQKSIREVMEQSYALYIQNMQQVQKIYATYPEDPVLKSLEDKIVSLPTFKEQQEKMSYALLIYFGAAPIQDSKVADIIRELALEYGLKMNFASLSWEYEDVMIAHVIDFLEKEFFSKLLALAKGSDDPFLQRFFQQCHDFPDFKSYLADSSFQENFEQAILNKPLTDAQRQVQAVLKELEQAADKLSVNIQGLFRSSLFC